MSDIKEQEITEYKTPTSELCEKYESCTNPVTRAVYRNIIATRIGITERQEIIKKSNNFAMRAYLGKCTFSFNGRKRMERLFDLWFMK